jgi:protein TonB
MVFTENRILKFIASSLVIHLLAVGLIVEFVHKEKPSIPVEITFSSGSTFAPKVQSSPQKAKAKIPKLTSPSPVKVPTAEKVVAAETAQQDLPTGASGMGNNIGTGTEGDGFGSTPGINSARSRYYSLIAQAIYRNKRYPRQAYLLNQEGRVVVKLKINKMGKILDVSIVEKAAFKTLTEASLQTIKSINRFPPIPDELGTTEMTFKIPIEYKIEI